MVCERRSRWLLAILFFTVWVAAAPASAQVFITEPERTVTLPRGTSAVLITPVNVSRISIADPEIAEAVAMAPKEVLVNGKALGTTTFVVWDVSGTRRIYGVEVTADPGTLGRHLSTLFPGEKIEVAARGKTLILSGRVTTAFVARRALELAQATGATVIDNLQRPAAPQILLQVRIAEVSQNALKQLGNQIIDVLNPHRLDTDGDWRGTTDSNGEILLSLINSDAHLRTIIRALQESGDFRTLAEPNLLALDGQEASFLAGGEFPFPTVQGAVSGAGAAVSIEWREFGVRLNFKPQVTNAGNIHLTLAPEVSSLDFAGGLVISGFSIPTILTRRASTQVELREGQHLAIAGLMDRTMQDNIRKLPILGDIPILGALFQTKSKRQEVSELLVIVSPRIVTPTNQPPPLPTGDPSTWNWDKRLAPRSAPPDSVRN